MVLLVQQQKTIGWEVGLLGPAQFEASCPFCSALFSGCLSLLIIVGTDTGGEWSAPLRMLTYLC